MVTERIKELAKKYEDYTLETRGYLHENPEISSEEFETSKFLKEEIKKLGFEIVEAEGTGFIGILDSGKEGKTIGIRADIDALKMEEAETNLLGKRKYLSKNKEAAHMCGHDGHMATSLSVAKIFSDMKDELKGKVIFIFEEGEEMNTGIHKMMALLENIKFDYIIGNHLAAFVDSGKFALQAGPRMAGHIQLGIVVKGKGGHGSRPDLAINPIFAQAQILSGLGTAWANQIDVTKTVTLGIGQVHGGTAYNIIPEETVISGSMRFFDVEEGKKAMKVVENVAENVGRANRCEVSFNENHKYMCDPVINDEFATEVALKAIKDLYGEDAIDPDVIWFASESFYQYGRLCPILLNLPGIRNPEVGSGADHHNVHFDIDEDALKMAVVSTAKIAYDLLMS